VHIAHTTVEANSAPAGEGGGLFNRHGTLTITYSLIAHNGAQSGGGLANDGGAVDISDTIFEANSASGAGGIINGSFSPIGMTGGMMTITRSTVSNNHTSSLSGGIFNRHLATLTITQSTIAGNFAGDAGGGIGNFGTLSLITSTLAHNQASNAAGGLGNEGTTDIVNSTIAENSVSGSSTLGGGIWTHGGTVDLQNTILARNIAGRFGQDSDCFGPVTSLGNNLIGDSTGWHCYPATQRSEGRS
jgi:hypothetical protein